MEVIRVVFFFFFFFFFGGGGVLLVSVGGLTHPAFSSNDGIAPMGHLCPKVVLLQLIVILLLVKSLLTVFLQIAKSFFSAQFIESSGNDCFKAQILMKLLQKLNTCILIVYT